MTRQDDVGLINLSQQHKMVHHIQQREPHICNIDTHRKSTSVYFLNSPI